MKIVIRLFILLACIAGVAWLIRLSNDNRQLSDQLDQLEAELGRMSIDDPKRVHLVEIDTPDVPPEVASHLERVWQFRCYLPAGYDVMRISGGGRVTKEGSYLDGGSNSGWGSPPSEATHKLLTVSFQRKDDRWNAFYSFGGSSGTSSWGGFNPDRFDETVVVQKLVSSEQGPRSFDQGTILPLLKVFDPTTAEAKEVAGKTLTTYAGGLIVLCPKSREPQFSQLLKGKTPVDFDPNWIATEESDE
ncbi:MAG: hypothetical protein ACO1RT_08125 [Planctomycetaceae bacterium]